MYHHFERKLSIRSAAQEAGISEKTGRRLATGTKQSPGVDAKRRQDDMPAPKTLEQLGPEALAALEDFDLFGEMFFALRPAPWRRDAAMRLVDGIQDHGERTFIDLNLFPGAGKTTQIKVFLCWLIAGGGVVDPSAGRGIRGMVGSEVQKVARHMLRAVRLPLELRKPFAMFDRDKREWIEAEYCLATEYGRFKPDTTIGEESLWSQDQILVAQLQDVDLVLKEPTLQVASKESGFLGERIDVAIWDDLSTTKNSRTPEIAAALDKWFENEAETRVEKGGVLVLIGQRLSPLDLHRKRLDAKVENSATGELVPLYQHITYPSHRDDLCTGEHSQWDPSTGAGCMTDMAALPVKDWEKVRSKQDYRTVYQQEDADPAKILVQPAWLEGGLDLEGVMSPGSHDRDRGFWEWPKGVGQLIDYVAVDPSAGNWWVAEWWAVQPETRHNYLIEGRRLKIQAGAFLDWDNAKQEFSGWMHEMQVASIIANHPIRVWIIEAVAAHKYLFQFEHFRRWKQMFPYVSVIPHQTQLNKNDPELGVEGLMPGRYRTGMKHLPRKSGDIAALNYMRVKEKELTTYPFAEADDTVMADWVGEWNIDKVIMIGRRAPDKPVSVDPGLKLPKYLRQQFESVELNH